MEYMKYIGTLPEVIDDFGQIEDNDVSPDLEKMVSDVVMLYDGERPHTVLSLDVPKTETESNYINFTRNYIAKVNNNGTCFMVTDDARLLNYFDCSGICAITYEQEECDCDEALSLEKIIRYDKSIDETYNDYRKCKEIAHQLDKAIEESLLSIDDENVGYYKTITRVANILRMSYSRYHKELS